MPDLSSLTRCPLFAGVAHKDLDPLLTCLAGRISHHTKGAVILGAGDRPDSVGIVLDGRVYITKEDYFGNRNILTQIGPGGLFAEALACAGVEASPVGVVASEDCRILRVAYRRITNPCSESCGLHPILVQNMLRVLAQKNIALVDKLECLTRRTTQDKVMSYLVGQATRHQSNTIDIPFNRQGLADFLSVDRSSLSTELSKLQKQGKIRYHKNHFELLGT
ncbi:MAG: Crp/Fnr family transcriptional regulator [Propionibacteriaceae bacterium]|nr:Crp/Fnr family transcriptional regulator [Propionibacteriaceae bacterium]